MGKTMCEAGRKIAKGRLSENPRFECQRCHSRVKKKDWVCKPSKL